MIKTRKELRKTYIRNTGKLAEIWVKMTDCGGMASWAESYYLCCGSNGEIMFMPKYTHLGEQSSIIWFENEGYRELTLADFEPESTSEPEVKPTPKYNYVLVDKSPEEIYRAMLDGEVFYEHDGEVEVYFDGDSFLSRDTNNGARKFIKGIPKDNQICTRKEVKWKDEVLDYLRMPSVNGFEEELPTKITVSFDGEDFYLTGSEFLEAARVALKATGELS